MLILPIKGKWFDMIVAKEKKEEYRDIKPYYTKRFETIGLLDQDGNPTDKTCPIILKNGYAKDARTAQVTVSLRIGTGNTDWGAAAGVNYYILGIDRLGE